MYPLVKNTSGSESSVSSSEASKDCVLQEARSKTSDDDNIPLEKLASSSWSDSDSEVSLRWGYMNLNGILRGLKKG